MMLVDFILLLLARPLGIFMARIYQGELLWSVRPLLPLERLFYRPAGVDEGQEMTWLQYALALLMFNVLRLNLALDALTTDS